MLPKTTRKQVLFAPFGLLFREVKETAFALFLVLHSDTSARRKIDEQRLVRLCDVRGSHSTEAPFPSFWRVLSGLE